MSVHRNDRDYAKAISKQDLPQRVKPEVAAQQKQSCHKPVVPAAKHVGTCNESHNPNIAKDGGSQEQCSRSESHSITQTQPPAVGHVDQIAMLQQATHDAAFSQPPTNTPSLYQTVMNIGRSSGLIPTHFPQYQTLDAAFVNTNHFYQTEKF